MSYILEALRKSESERHQGEVPNLGASPMLIHAGRRERPVWPYWLAGALILNAAVVGAWLLGSRSASTGSSVTNATSIPNPAVSEPVASTSAVTAPQALAEEMYPAPVTAIAPPPVTQQMYALPGAIPGLATPTQQATGASRNIPGYPTAQPRASAEANWEVVTPSRQGAEPLLITPNSARQSLAYDPELGYMDDTAPVSLTASSMTSLSQVPADTPAIDVPRIDELPRSFQARVPALTFNSHIYSSDPSARRVMVNNVYLREGQPFKGMVVQEITDEGAIFVMDGVMFEVSSVRGWGRR